MGGDGTTDSIARLAATVHVKEEQAPLFATYFKKWLVATIASLLDAKVVNHEILVFIGKQGIYKTTWMQRLLPTELQRYFYVKTNNRRRLLRLKGIYGTMNTIYSLQLTINN